jgi:tetratricopeptide (TPR) repeat protein
LVFKGLHATLLHMRSGICAIFAFAVMAAPAAADQTDPRLDLLFEELRTGDAIRADDNVRRIIEIWSDSQSDTVDILYARAEESTRNGAFGLAEALLDHVVGLSPSFAQGYALRGAVRLAEDDRDGAIDDFTRALELEPRQFEVRTALAEILLAADEKRDAYDMFQKVLEWNPHDEHARDRARVLRRELDGQEI